MDFNQFDAAKRAAAGDCVVYSIYLPWIQSKGPKNKKDIIIELEAAKIQFELALAPHLKGYLWNQSAFCLFVDDSQDSANIRPHLAGYTNVGDNIEDEWFVVFLLLQLSKTYPDIIIRAVDQDGQFLLIEAAQELPEWLEPDNSDNRVFLRGGEVHILPLHVTPTKPNPPLCECLAVMARAKRQYVAKKSIQNIIRRRVQLDIQENSYHISTCVVPVTVANVLKEAPESIALAVNAFYGRDDIDTKAAMRMPRFKPTGIIDYPVRFTRTLFAKLNQQQFHAPRCFVPVLAEVDGKATGKERTAEARKMFRSRSLGMKLAVAFEMLAARHQKLFDDPPAPPRIPSRAEALADPDWEQVQVLVVG